MNNVRGLCFDGASNMSGRYQGASACIKRKYHLALYFHCASHRLNLSVAGACNNICSVKKIMSCIKKCTDIFLKTKVFPILPKKSLFYQLPRTSSKISRKIILFCDISNTPHFSLGCKNYRPYKEYCSVDYNLYYSAIMRVVEPSL